MVRHPTELDPALSHSARLSTQIRAEIAAAGGALPFDRFMEMALYAPGLGYYVAGAVKFGAGGDFVTGPDISPLFGACLAVQCAEALTRLGGGDILEFGAGTGTLAVQVLQGLERADNLPHRYFILEPSPELQARQQALIQARLPRQAGRCQWLTGLPRRLRGLILANEVLDAMPVHRFRIGMDGDLEEIFVTDRDGLLAETTGPVRSPGLAEAVTALHRAGLATSPGYCSEVNLRLPAWCAALGEILEAGLALIIDYGYPASGYYQPDRTMGTLLCHQRHQAHPDPYRTVGLQDITAHVNFSALAQAGRAAGLEVAGFTTQAHFLIGCGIHRLVMDESDAIGTDPALGLGVRQLILPTAMGEIFKVIALSRHLPGPWCGFAQRDLRDRL